MTKRIDAMHAALAPGAGKAESADADASSVAPLRVVN